MVGNLITSLAGHDKNQVYIIIKEDKEYVYLSDGELKPITKPKKKNKKHIQIIKKDIDALLKQKLINGDVVRDEEIKRTIKLYELKINKQI